MRKLFALALVALALAGAAAVATLNARPALAGCSTPSC